jgi:alpha-mannosidase
LSAKINTQPAGSGLEPIIVFNPLGWPRADVVRYAVKGSGKFQVFDRAGKELRSQAVATEQGESNLYFSPESIPALGWKTFYVKAGAACARPGPLIKEDGAKIVIENDLIKVAVDKKTGLLSSLFDKRLGKEMLKSPSNKVVAYTDRPAEYSAWNLAEDYLNKPIAVPAASSVKVDAQGPVFVRVLVERKGHPTSFKQWITVYSGSPLINLITWSDLHWKNSITKVEFNTSVETDQVATEIPYAVISRSTHATVPWDRARTEMPVEKWADLSTKDFGISLLNFGKYAFSLTEDGAGFRMSIVKNAKYPTAAIEAYEVNPLEKIIPFPETDAGEHWAHLALLSHPGDWKAAKVYRAAYEYNTPVVVYRAQAHAGGLPAEMSMLSLESESAYIAQVKKAEDDGDLVVRIVEGEGRDSSATLKVNPAFKIKSAAETNLLELEPKPVKFNEQSATVSIGHFEIKTLKLKLAVK